MTYKFSIKLDNNKITDALKIALEKKLDAALNDITDFIGNESDRILRDDDEGSFDTGFLANSLVVSKDKKLYKEVGYSAMYACVVGRHNGVKISPNKSKGIYWVSINDKVFSKDGNYHNIISKNDSLRVFNKPNLILLNYEKTRQKRGLLVTDDHLILIYKNNYVYWEEAKNLQIGDFVIKPRKIPHNKGLRSGIIRTCLNCGNNFYIQPSEIKYRKANYCSKQCYHKSTYHNRAKGKTWRLTLEQRLNKSGKNNPSYIDGRSINHSKLVLYGTEWTDDLKESIKERDNYICQLCNIEEAFYDYSFHVHHIDANKFNNKPENLITLCPSCHGKQQWRECELVTIDWEIFEPVKLTKVDRIDAFKYFTGKGAMKKVKLYDLQIDNENSFVCGGIIIHNSFIEYGTSPHFPPLDIIYNWLIHKKSDLKLTYDKKKTTKLNGKTYNAGILKIAWAIAKNMEKKGTEPAPFLRPSFNLGKSKTSEFIKKAMKKN